MMEKAQLSMIKEESMAGSTNGTSTLMSPAKLTNKTNSVASNVTPGFGLGPSTDSAINSPMVNNMNSVQEELADEFDNNVAERKALSAIASSSQSTTTNDYGTTSLTRSDENPDYSNTNNPVSEAQDEAFREKFAKMRLNRQLTPDDIANLFESEVDPSVLVALTPKSALKKSVRDMNSALNPSFVPDPLNTDHAKVIDNAANIEARVNIALLRRKKF